MMHDASIVASLALLLNQVFHDKIEKKTISDLLTDSLTIHLIGSKGNHDDIARNACKVMAATPHIIYQWLAIL